MTGMVPSCLMQKCNKLDVIFSIKNELIDNSTVTHTSPEYMINSSAMFQMMTIMTNVNYTKECLIFMKFHKVRMDDEFSYRLNFSSKHLEIVNKVIMCDDGTWHLIKKYPENAFRFDVKLVMDTIKEFSFASLHSDTELTDFELRGKDGSVRVHKATLAASSPVLRAMLSGDWREAAEGKVKVPGTTQATLQHLKDYIYLQTLPNAGLEQLLLLASYYMIPDLEQVCVDKLVAGLTARNACDLLEFATNHKMTKLLLATLECVQSGAVAVKDIREHFVPLNNTDTD